MLMRVLLPHRLVAAKTLCGSRLEWPLCDPLHDAISTALVERSDPGCVERTVNRAKVILALLLPALWVTVSANCPLDPSGVCASNPPKTSISAGGHAKHDGSSSASSFRELARRWSRRASDRSGPPESSTPFAISEFRPPQLERVEAIYVGSGSSFGLANCWQFRWRTALEPRAPSSVS